MRRLHKNCFTFKTLSYIRYFSALMILVALIRIIVQLFFKLDTDLFVYAIILLCIAILINIIIKVYLNKATDGNANEL